ncbi:hypothetical protein HGA64_02530 [Candidatus Falkowbacteria bacterium]|nr:hypothetical protein [Candidatus Falkowbacteria bacterium]
MKKLSLKISRAKEIIMVRLIAAVIIFLALARVSQVEAACIADGPLSASTPSIEVNPLGISNNYALLVMQLPTINPDIIYTIKVSKTAITARNVGSIANAFVSPGIGAVEGKARGMYLTNLSANTVYYVVVKSTDNCGGSVLSNVVKFTTSVAPVVKNAHFISWESVTAPAGKTLSGYRVVYGPTTSSGFDFSIENGYKTSAVLQCDFGVKLKFEVQALLRDNTTGQETYESSHHFESLY